MIVLLVVKKNSQVRNKTNASLTRDSPPKKVGCKDKHYFANSKKFCQNFKSSRIVLLLYLAHEGTSAKLLGTSCRLIRERDLCILGTFLKAKIFLPRDKKSFEPAQKLVRLGANEIKNTLVWILTCMQRYKILKPNARIWLKFQKVLFNL